VTTRRAAVAAAAPIAAADEPLAAWLSGRRVLVAYGLLGDTTAALRRFGVDYMWAQQDWLRAVGAAPEVVPAPTAAAVSANAARIRAALLAAERPALVIAHSKGGVEALAALLDPAAAARCAGLVAFQSPFGGSPVADLFAGSRALHGFALAGFRVLRIGNGEGLRDLTTPVRAGWMRAHAEAVAGLVRRVPVVAAATVLEAAALRGARGRAYGALARWMERQAGPNDGLVPLSSALLPGARHIVEPGGHVALVSANGGGDPVGALRRAVRMVVD
jgi:hypothetical protein